MIYAFQCGIRIYSMIALVSDIHSNLEALKAVLAHIKNQNISEIICLGDIVGYGADPIECVQIARQFKLTIMGNHDEGLISSPIGFTPMAREALEWTISQMKPGLMSSRSKRDNWKFMESLPIKYEDGNVFYVHGSPRQPTTEYILRNDCDTVFDRRPQKLEEIFSMIRHLCFVGHTHDPGIIADNEYRFLTPAQINYTYEVKEGIKLIVNVGSVGQPRDGDNRACYVTFDGKIIQYQRVEYDYHLTQEKILKIPELESRFAERLAEGR